MAGGRRPVDGRVARELETLGYGALWSSGRFDPGLSPHFERLLASTTRVPVARGIVSIWASTPEDVGPAVAELEARFPGRFLLGLGASHAPMVEHYARPYSRLVAYLDALDALDTPVPPDRRVLAALGPRMLELAAARAAGAHPYFVPVEHTARARAILGPGPLLAPEVAVVLEADPGPGTGAGARLRPHLPRPAQLHAEPAHLRLRGRRHRRRRERPPDRRRHPLGRRRRPWRGASASTTTRGRTTSASRSSRTGRASRSTSTVSWRRRSSGALRSLQAGGAAGVPQAAPARSANRRARPRKARPRCDTASFSSGRISANVRPSPPSGTNTGS